eukprot:s2640_g6.t1
MALWRICALACHAVAAAKSGCWDGVFTAESCCDLGTSPWGRSECWSGAFTFKNCCHSVGTKQQSVQNLSRRLDGFEQLLDHMTPAAALNYLRMFIPAKFDLLQRHRQLKSKQSRANGRQLDRLFAKETSFISRLHAKTVTMPKIFPPRHSYCKRSWSFSLFADCASHLSKVVDALANHQQVKNKEFQDTMHEAFCHSDHIPVIGGFQISDVSWRPRFAGDLELVLLTLRDADCLAEQIALYFACGLSRLSRAMAVSAESNTTQVVELLGAAANFVEGAALRMLLCDGCRWDGRGLSVVQLDQALWILGFLRNEERNEETVYMELATEFVGQRYRAALVQFQGHPGRWWHRQQGLSGVYGRVQHCPMALTDLCVQSNQLILRTQDLQTPAALGSCHLDFGMLDFTPLKAFSFNSTSNCNWSSHVALLLPLSVVPHRSLTHPTGFFTWFLPALALFQGGEKTRKLLLALWQRDGIHGGPEKLEPGNTDVFLVPYGDSTETVGLKSNRFHFFLQMLSPRVRSIQELQEDECHCYKVALWGFPDPSLRLHGDLDWRDAEHFRRTFRYHLMSHGIDKADKQSAENLAEHLQHFHPNSLGLLFAYRTAKVFDPEEGLQRRISNQDAVFEALAELVRRTPPLHLMYLSWEKLSIVDQVRLALDFVDILVQPFGAGMSWSLFLPAGSYVVELQQDSIDTAHFVSCFRPNITPAIQEGLSGYDSPWEPATNAHSEWGAWAFMNKINFACVSNRPTYAHCKRSFSPTIWDTPFIDVDIDTVTTLVADAARRLTYARNRSHHASMPT